MPVLQSLIAVVLLFLGVELLCYWIPLLGVLFRRRPAEGEARQGRPAEGEARQGRPVPANAGRELTFAILTACRDGAACVPGFVKTFQEQDYPAVRVKQFLVADHCKDNSAELARSMGMGVHERPPQSVEPRQGSGGHAPSVPGKGNACSEILQERLRHESFDVLVVMDIDARVERDFLKRASVYFQHTPQIIACATFAKNPDETLLGRVGTLIQGLLRLHQEGRAAWGQNALIFGSHGYALSRDALEALGWRTTTGLVAEDMELRLRSTLQRLPIGYASDLTVYNDVTSDAASVHQQRLRWNATYPPLIARYTWPLLRGGRFDALFGALWLPAFANLFLFLSVAMLTLAILAWKIPALFSWAMVATVLWGLHVLYFLVAFRAMRVRLSARDFRGFVAHLGIRTSALFGGFFKVHIKDWAPAPHPEEKK